jgi:hypothetical protein
VLRCITLAGVGIEHQRRQFSRARRNENSLARFTFPDGRRSPRPTIAAVSVSKPREKRGFGFWANASKRGYTLRCLKRDS